MDGTQRIKNVKTRIAHVCDCCNKTYPAGTVMEHASGLSITEDGIFPYSIYICQKCIEEGQIDEGEEAYMEHLDIR